MDLAHLRGPPVGNPVDEPEEVTDEGNCEQEHQLQLVVLLSKKLDKLLASSYKAR